RRVDMTGRWTRAAVLAGAAAVLCAGLAGTAAARVDANGASAATVVKVGFIYSKTGALSAFGQEEFDGFNAGIAYTKGKCGNYTISPTFVDDATDPAKAIAAAKDLIGQGYKIVAGTASSGIALQLAPLAAQNNILYISGAAASDAITGVNRNTFRAGRQTIQDVLTAASFLGRTTGKKVLVCAQASAFGQGNVAAVKAYIGGKGHTVSQVLVPLSATDFTPFAQQAKNANADLMFVAWAGTTAGAMWRALDQQGVLSSTTVTTGLAERATWGSYGDPSTASKIKFLSHYVYTAP